LRRLLGENPVSGGFKSMSSVDFITEGTRNCSVIGNLDDFDHVYKIGGLHLLGNSVLMLRKN
jgi:hypothetical protein